MSLAANVARDRVAVGRSTFSATAGGWFHFQAMPCVAARPQCDVRIRSVCIFREIIFSRRQAGVNSGLMKKLPSHLMLLRGNAGKRPVESEPEPTAPDKPPDPPAFLSEDAQNEWWQVAPELHALGLLTILDVAALAVYCQAYSHWVTAERMIASMATDDPETKGLTGHRQCRHPPGKSAGEDRTQRGCRYHLR